MQTPQNSADFVNTKFIDVWHWYQGLQNLVVAAERQQKLKII